MRVSAAYVPGRPGLSFELFPPKTAAGETDLFAQLAALMAFRPSLVTCTYGAGGSTRAKTLDIVTEVRRRFACPVASHLTCVGSTVDQLRQYLAEASDRGVENIVALRGDPPRGEAGFRPCPGGLAHANELVALIRAEFPGFGVAVAGYPETHQEAESPQADLAHLKRKVDAGGEVVITQLFYRNEDYFRFVDRAREAGIGVPIVPGVLPVTNLAQIKRLAALCGARLPPDFLQALEACQDDGPRQFEVGIEYATRQVRDLLERGAPGIHFYVLNKSQAAARILTGIGWRS
jgi:methylenetetrahydrofolate reductase (NADPH)